MTLSLWQGLQNLWGCHWISSVTKTMSLKYSEYLALFFCIQFSSVGNSFPIPAPPSIHQGYIDSYTGDWGRVFRFRRPVTIGTGLRTWYASITPHFTKFLRRASFVGISTSANSRCHFHLQGAGRKWGNEMSWCLLSRHMMTFHPSAISSRQAVQPEELFCWWHL